MKTYQTLLIILICCVTNLFAQDNLKNSITEQETLSNLQSAYEDEANASHKYELYSIKAAAEGFDQAAEVFAALSVSENIHSLNHQEAIISLGETPAEPKINNVEVKSTKENLEESMMEENMESRTMYPQYIEEAQKEHVNKAVESFTYSQKSEAEHSNLLEDAIDNLCKNSTDEYYINNLTGETLKIPESSPAPQGNTEEGEYIKIEIFN